MSVTNRKMFNRAARNKVRQMGGIMASSEPLIQEVARFQNGGGVTQSTIDFLNKYVNPLDARGRIKALEYLRENAPGVMSPIDKYVNPFDTKTGNLKALQYLYEKTLPDRVTDKAEGVGAFPRTSEVLKNIQLREPTDKVQGQTGAITGKALQGAIDVGTLAASGIGDFLLEGMGSNRLGSAQISGNDLRNMFEGKTPMRDLDGKPMTQREFQAQVANSMQLSNDEKRAMFGMTDEYLAQGDEELDKITEALTPEALKKQEEDRKKAETIAMREAEKKTAVEGGMPDPAQTVTEEGVKDLQDQISGGRISSGAGQTLGVTADQGEEAKLKAESKKVLDGQGDISNIENQVKNTFNSGVGVKGAIKQFMDEFVSNAPEYKGLDRGLAIAKIGFAMAAGESPNAITNIAKALSDGADMFIKDNAQRDAFKRQVDLAGLQYAVGEVGKQRAQARADRRNIMKFVATDDLEFKGVKYKKGQDVLLSMADLLANGGRLPPGLRDQGLHLAMTKAVLDNEAKLAKALEEQRKERIIDDAQANTIQKNYTTAASNFKSADTGIAYLQQAVEILAVHKGQGKVTGAGGIFNDFVNRSQNFLGIKLGEKYDNVEKVRRLFAQGLQPLIKTTLGEVQSANSISNRDVDFLIKAFFGDDALEKGVFNFATTSNTEMISRVQAAMNAMRDAQIKDLKTMQTLERRLINRTLPGEQEIGSALTLIADQQQSVAPFLPGAQNQMNPGGVMPIIPTGTQNGIPTFTFKRIETG